MPVLRTTLGRALLALPLLSLVGCNDPSPAAETVAAAPTVKKKRADREDGSCDVSVSGPATSRVGEEGVAKVSLRPTGGFEVNQEAPLSVRIASTELEVTKQKWTVDDASVLAPEEVTMDIPFTPLTAGSQTLEVHAHFGLCSGESCELCRRKAEMTTLVN